MMRENMFQEEKLKYEIIIYVTHNKINKPLTK